MLVKYDCYLFIERFVEMKKKVKNGVTPKTGENFISITYGCLRFKVLKRFSDVGHVEVTNTSKEYSNQYKRSYSEIDFFLQKAGIPSWLL